MTQSSLMWRFRRPSPPSPKELSNRNDPPDRYVYFIRDSGSDRIKIGLSKQPEARRRQLQTGNPTDLELLLKIRGDRHLEDRLHRSFEGYRCRDEWFEPHPELLRYIEWLEHYVEDNFQPVSYGLCVWMESITTYRLVFKDFNALGPDDKATAYEAAPCSIPRDIEEEDLFAVTALASDQIVEINPELFRWTFNFGNTLRRRRSRDESVESIRGIQPGYRGPAIFLDDFAADGGTPLLAQVTHTDGDVATFQTGPGREYEEPLSRLRHPGDPLPCEIDVTASVWLLRKALASSTALVADHFPTDTAKFLDQLSRAIVAEAYVNLGMTTRDRAAKDRRLWKGDGVISRRRGGLR